jgi:uncharacterized protein YyaL (SSP411 family)
MSQSIHVRIEDADLWREFKSYVKMKHGKIHTVLGLEVENAIRCYLKDLGRFEHAHTHTEDSSGNASAKKVSSRTLNNLKKVVARILKETEKEIPQTTVEKIITETVGGDNRTLTRYNGMLLDYGIVKPVRPMFGVQKFIYEVNVPVAKSFISDVYEADTTRRIL